MPSPTLTPPASLAPLLAASMTPGPPPVITANPASASLRPASSATAYDGFSGLVRAEPKTLIAGPSSASAPNPSTNSAWIRSTRQKSVWVSNWAPRSNNRWSAVLPVPRLSRLIATREG
jgi:hypothetical protein